MKELFGLSDEERDLIREILETAGESLERVSVFGSRASGRARTQSDLDLVLYGNIDESIRARLWTLFQESRLPFSVDLKVYEASTYPPLRSHIDRAAKPLFVRTKRGLEEATSMTAEVREHHDR